MATISTNDIKIRYDIDLTKLQQATEQFDKITAEERAMLRELGKLKKQLDDAAESAKKFGKESQKGFNASNNGITTITSSATKMAGVLGGIFAASKIVDFGKAVIETTVKFEAMKKAIDFASGSVEAGNKNFEFLRELASKLGLDLRATAEGYKTFASASNLAGQSSQETNRQFAAVAKAAQVMGLSAEDTKGAFLALGQMMSKGNVQAEELRGQLGERLVGAFGIAAKAMGVTTAELNKMLQKGQVLALDFLPKFATELENTFGKGNVQVTTLAASQSRFNSSIDELILAIGNKLNPFLKGAYDLAAGIATSLQQAAGGGAAKKATDDQIAARRIETELAKEVLKLDQQRVITINASNIEGVRRQVARNQLMGMEARIDAQMAKVAEARIAAAGTMNSRIQSNLTKQEKELLVLQQMEEQYAKIAGVIVNTPPPPPPIDEKAAKEAKKFEEEQYQRRLKLLQLERDLASLVAKIRFDNKIDLLREEYKAEEKLLKDVYNLQVEYAAKGVQAAKDGIEQTQLEKELNRIQTIRDLKTETQETLDAINKQRLANAKFDQERDKAQDERKIKREKTNFEIEQLELDLQEKLNELDKKFAKEREERRQKELDERTEIIQKAVELTQTISDGAFGIYQARINNEMSLLQKRYDLEVKLADGNQQKIDELTQKKAEKQREIQLKQFKAEQAAAVARVIFETASMIAKWSTNPVTAPLAALSILAQAAQIGAILAQPVPEFAEGTKGKPFKGGKAIVGERGVEKVVTESGKVYFTPPTATLMNLPKGSQVIPNHALSRQELFLASHYSKGGSSASPVVGEIRELGSILKGLPITQVSMDEKGFEKFIRTPRRTTKILNNRFRSDSV
jgi:tape measure domain-containing protein